MPPLLLALLSAAGGAFLYNRFDTARRAQSDLDAARQRALGMTARELLQGRSYGVQVAVDPKAPEWGGANAPRDLAAAARLVRATFQQLGWQFLADPALADQASARRFFAGEVAPWVFMGTWTRPERFQALAPRWAGMTLAQELPSVPGAAAIGPA